MSTVVKYISPLVRGSGLCRVAQKNSKPHWKMAQLLLDQFGFLSVGSNEKCDIGEVLEFDGGTIVVTALSSRQELSEQKAWNNANGGNWTTGNDWKYYYRVVAE